MRIPDGSRNEATHEYCKLGLEAVEAGMEMIDIGGKKRKRGTRDEPHTTVSSKK